LTHDRPHSILLTFTPPTWFFDILLFDPQCTTPKVGTQSTTLKAILPTFTHRGSTLSVVDRGWNRRVSKNNIGGVKISRIALSVVDRGSNRRVSKNHIGGVKVTRMATTYVILWYPSVWPTNYHTQGDPANLYTTYVILWYSSAWPTIYH
jgi:hypothetical protein